MNRNIRYILGIVLATLFLSISLLPTQSRSVLSAVEKIPVIGHSVSWVASKSYHLGLDLRGGVKLVYDLDVAGIEPEKVATEVDHLIEFVRDRRVDQLGVSEPKIYSTLAEGQYHMVVELPGFQEDPEKAKAKIGGSVLLEFQERKEAFSADELADINARNSEVRTLAADVLQRAKNGEDFGDLAKEYTDDFDMKYLLGNYGFLPETSPEVAIVKDEASGIADDSVYPRVIETVDRLEIVKRHAVDEVANPKWSASHILFKSQQVTASMTPEEAEEAHAANEDIKKTALDVLSRVQRGENFGALATEFSDDIGTVSQGGSLGFFGKGVMVQSFEDAVLALEPGEITSELVETNFGYHIIKLDDYRAAEPTYHLSKIVFDLESTTPGQWSSTGLTGKQFQTAYVNYDPNSMQPVVNIVFDDEGGQLFAEVTKRNIGKQVAIFIDNALISAPVVRNEIAQGLAVISGGFDARGAQELANSLNMGATPINFTYIGGSEISPSLGAESLRISLQAGLIGYLLVALYMIAYYRLPGLLSVFALVLYAALTLSLYNILGVTMTLAGVAGFILSVGMAVDANILIFERMREEIKQGKGLSLASQLGFERAWTSIKDSNVSSLITCALLLLFGSGPIRGFAFTLGIGIVVSIFTAVTFTRLLISISISWFGTKKNFFGPTNTK